MENRHRLKEAMLVAKKLLTEYSDEFDYIISMLDYDDSIHDYIIASQYNNHEYFIGDINIKDETIKRMKNELLYRLIDKDIFDVVDFEDNMNHDYNRLSIKFNNKIIQPRNC